MTDRAPTVTQLTLDTAVDCRRCGRDERTGWSAERGLDSAMTMNLRLFGLRHLLVAAAALALSLSAKAQQPTPPNPPQLLQSANIPRPPGSFSSWPEDIREPATRGVRSRCMVVGGMAFADYQGPKEALRPSITAFLSACAAKQMPDDWPGKAAERQRSIDAYEAAKRLDLNAPDPDLLAEGLEQPH